MLNKMQKDLLKELVNVYVGQAASFLSEMVNQRIILTVPEVELVYGTDFCANIFGFDAMQGSNHIISSSIRFGHLFTGKAYLIFPAEQAKILVNSCLEDSEIISDSMGGNSLLDTDFDVLKEISNVILNAIIGEFANFLNTKLEYSLPEIELVFVSEAEGNMILKADIYILVLHTRFILADTQINGVVIVALSMDSVNLLLEKIDEQLGDMNE